MPMRPLLPSVAFLQSGQRLCYAAWMGELCPRGLVTIHAKAALGICILTQQAIWILGRICCSLTVLVLEEESRGCLQRSRGA